MLEAEVTQFMRQHRLDLRTFQSRNQRVEEYDAFVVAQAGEIGVAVS